VCDREADIYDYLRYMKDWLYLSFEKEAKRIFKGI
jgi:hypothetical protein